MALQLDRGANILPYRVLCLDVSCWVAAGSALPPTLLATTVELKSSRKIYYYLGTTY